MKKSSSMYRKNKNPVNKEIITSNYKANEMRI